MRRQLKILGFPNADGFNCDDPKQYRHLVCWLEDHKIRHFPIVERDRLRNVSGPGWPEAYRAYLGRLHCPFEWWQDQGDAVETVPVLTWLVGQAVKLQYMDHGPRLNHQANLYMEAAKAASSPSTVSSNPISDLDVQSKDFRQGVDELAAMLKVPPHPDHIVTLEACCKLIQTRLNKDAVANPSSVMSSGEPFLLADHDMGFSHLQDPALKEAAKILRLLQLNELRDLQWQINSCIELVQRATANPKTDTRLGKVGV